MQFEGTVGTSAERQRTARISAKVLYFFNLSLIWSFRSYMYLSQPPQIIPLGISKYLWHYYPWSLGHIVHSLNRLSSLGCIQPLCEFPCSKLFIHINHLSPHMYPFTPGWWEAYGQVSCSRTQLSRLGFEPTPRWLNHQNLSPLLLSARPRHSKLQYSDRTQCCVLWTPESVLRNEMVLWLNLNFVCL